MDSDSGSASARKVSRAGRIRLAFVTAAPLDPLSAELARRLHLNGGAELAVIITAPVGNGRDRQLGEAPRGLVWRLWDRAHPARDDYPGPAWFEERGVPVRALGAGGGAEAMAAAQCAGAEMILVNALSGLRADAFAGFGGKVIRIAPASATDLIAPLADLAQGDQAALEVAASLSDAVGVFAPPASRAIALESHDTLESVEIKVRLAAAALADEVLAGIESPSAGRVEDPIHGTGPSLSALDALAERLRARQADAHARLLERPDPYLSRWRWVKFALMWPLLAAKRRDLVRKGEAPITALFYHRVANDAASAITLPLEKFCGQIEFVRRRYPIIPLDEARRRLESGVNREPAFVITFDDGYAANTGPCHEYLRLAGVPATLFVSAGHVIGQRPFEHDARLGLTHCRAMTLAETNAEAARGMAIGAHGWFHENFAALDDAEIDRIQGESRRAIGEATGAAPTAFAFPFGIRGVHITRRAWERASRGFGVAASAFGGYNFPAAPAAPGALHLRRICHPFEPEAVAQIMDGFQGMTSVLLRRDLWGHRGADDPPW